jgi:hypothetical protein
MPLVEAAHLAMIPSPNASEPSFAMFFHELGSWLLTRLGLSEPATKTIAILLSGIATLGFIAAGLALFGVLVPFDWWRALAIASVVILVTLLFTKWSPG